MHLQENFELTHETLYLAVKLMDHYLVQVGAMRDKLQLIGSTAILIASKFEVSPHSSGSGEALSSLGVFASMLLEKPSVERTPSQASGAEIVQGGLEPPKSAPVTPDLPV